MGNLFDGLQDAAHTVVSNTMGYAAAWTPSVGGPVQTATVLFNEPTGKADIADQEYAASLPRIEYFKNDFVGLADAVRGNRVETITVNGIDYVGYKVERKYDGKTILIYLQPAE